jgi:accessory gene regulator protein AgrB
MSLELNLLFYIGLAFILIGILILFLPNVKEKQPFTETEKEEKKKKRFVFWWGFKKYQTQIITSMLAILCAFNRKCLVILSFIFLPILLEWCAIFFYNVILKQ